MTAQDDFRWLAFKHEHPHPRIFLTVVGAHLYGFPSHDSDFDLRGAHAVHPDLLLGIDQPPGSIAEIKTRDGLEIDLVTHELAKYCKLLLKPNHAMLEQLLSPLIVETSPAHDEMKALAAGCLTRPLGASYIGFAQSQRKLMLREDPPRVKPLLYLFRVLLTGIHLMRGGGVESNLVRLKEEYGYPMIDELIHRKTEGREREKLPGDIAAHYLREADSLQARLQAEWDNSQLPETHAMKAPFNDFVLRVRRSFP